ncbi:MAG: hypothetical protein WCQ53_05530, partial [bacterium]
MLRNLIAILLFISSVASAQTALTRYIPSGESNPSQAAYEIDKLLGLNMTLETTSIVSGGITTIVQKLPANNKYVTYTATDLPSDVSIFDFLVGIVRPVSSKKFIEADGKSYVIDTEEAFSNSWGLAEYLRNMDGIGNQQLRYLSPSEELVSKLTNAKKEDILAAIKPYIKEERVLTSFMERLDYLQETLPQIKAFKDIHQNRVWDMEQKPFADEITTEQLLSLNNEAEKYLDELGVKYQIDASKRSYLELKKGSLSINHDPSIAKNVKLYLIESGAAANAKIVTPYIDILKDPEFPTYLSAMKKEGYVVVLDPSIFVSKAGAYFSEQDYNRIIGIWKNLPKSSFVHEFTHFEFAIILKKLRQILVTVNYESYSSGIKFTLQDILDDLKFKYPGLETAQAQLDALKIEYPMLGEISKLFKETGLDPEKSALNELLAVRHELNVFEKYYGYPITNKQTLHARRYAMENIIYELGKNATTQALMTEKQKETYIYAQKELKNIIDLLAEYDSYNNVTVEEPKITAPEDTDGKNAIVLLLGDGTLTDDVTILEKFFDLIYQESETMNGKLSPHTLSVLFRDDVLAYMDKVTKHNTGMIPDIILLTELTKGIV